MIDERVFAFHCVIDDCCSQCREIAWHVSLASCSRLCAASLDWEVAHNASRSKAAAAADLWQALSDNAADPLQLDAVVPSCRSKLQAIGDTFANLSCVQ